MPATDFALKLEFDTAGDETWAQDETGRLQKASIRRGRPDALSQIRAGTMSLTLQNRDGRYSPDKGIITGLSLFTPVRLYCQWTPGARTNIVRNPSAEVNATDYHAQGGATIVLNSADSWVGAKAMKATTANAVDSGIDNITSAGRHGVSAGTAYSFSAYVKGTAGKTLKLVIKWYDNIVPGLGSLLQTDSAAFTLGSGWVRPGILNVTAPTGAVGAELFVLTNSAQGVFDFWADGWMLYAGAAHDTYVDGTQPGCTWSGTAHLSQSSRPATVNMMIFQGFVNSLDVIQDKKNQTAQIQCIDRMGLWPQVNVSMGNLILKYSSAAIHRALDRMEPELISEPSFEWASVGLHPIAGGSPTTKWSWIGTGGGGLTFNLIDNSGATYADILEGDYSINAGIVTALDGAQYLATADITATGTYMVSIWARVTAGTRAVRLRFLRDAVVEATKTYTLTTSWQRLTLKAPFSTLGTNRYIQLVADATAAASTVQIDCLHACPWSLRVRRSIDAGAHILPLVNAYREPGHSVIGDIAESEPGIVYVMAGVVGTGETDGDTVRFADANSRSSVIPRAVFGDGDGLLQFDDGLGYALDAMDRVTMVSVSSRGTPKLSATNSIPAWEISPTRAVVIDEKIYARYQQTCRQAVAWVKGGAAINLYEKNFGIGYDVEVTTADADAYIGIKGYVYDYPTEQPVVTKRNASHGLPFENHLTVQMPWQGTNSGDCANEAQRLLDKYKNDVIRCRLPLHQRDDAVQAWQYDLEIGDQVIVRAKFEDHSPGIDKKMFVEGITHEIDGQAGGAIKTTLLLEEA